MADPHVIFAEDAWYLYGTRTFVNLEAWRSEDLATWTYEGVIWAPTPGSWSDHPTIWAPHVEPMEEGYALYYSANGRIGAARGSGPIGPFEDVGTGPLVGGGAGGIGDGVYESADYDVEDASDFLADAEEYAIDPFLLRERSGRLSLWFARLLPQSVIAMVPMQDAWTVAPGAVPEVVLDLSADASWEGFNREGPWVIEDETGLWLTYSGNYWWTTDYAVGAARRTGPSTPFERQAGGPILATDASLGTLGPGHHSIAPDREGSRLIFYHNKVSAGDHSPRRTRYARLTEGPAGLQVERD